MNGESVNVISVVWEWYLFLFLEGSLRVDFIDEVGTIWYFCWTFVIWTFYFLITSNDVAFIHHCNRNLYASKSGKMKPSMELCIELMSLKKKKDTKKCLSFTLKLHKQKKMNQKSKSNIQKMDSNKSFYQLLASDAFFSALDTLGTLNLKGGKMHEQKWMQIYCKCTRCSQLGCIGEGFLFGFASNALLAFRQCLFDFFLGCKWAMHSGKEWLIFLVVVSKKIAKSSGFNSWLWILTLLYHVDYELNGG